VLSALLCAGLDQRAGAWFVNERAKRETRGDAGTRENERANQKKNRFHKISTGISIFNSFHGRSDTRRFVKKKGRGGFSELLGTRLEKRMQQ
jgi:hypothetical protein